MLGELFGEAWETWAYPCSASLGKLGGLGEAWGMLGNTLGRLGRGWGRLGECLGSAPGRLGEAWGGLGRLGEGFGAAWETWGGLFYRCSASLGKLGRLGEAWEGWGNAWGPRITTKTRITPCHNSTSVLHCCKCASTAANRSDARSKPVCNGPRIATITRITPCHNFTFLINTHIHNPFFCYVYTRLKS